MLAQARSASAVHPTVMCAAHYFDIQQNVVAQGWYEQGLRLLDVSDPADIRQVGYFIPPNAESWAAYFPPTDETGRIVYMLDVSLGLAVLEFDRPTEGPLAMPVREEEEEEEPGGGGVPDDDDDQGQPHEDRDEKEKPKGSHSGSEQGGGAQVSGGGSGGGSGSTAGEVKKLSCKTKKTKKA